MLLDNIDKTALTLHWGLGTVPNINSEDVCFLIKGHYNLPIQLALGESGLDIVSEKILEKYPDTDKIDLGLYELAFFSVIKFKLEEKFMTWFTPAESLEDLYNKLEFSFTDYITEEDRENILSVIKPITKSTIYGPGYKGDMSIKITNLFKEEKIPLDISWKELCKTVNRY